MKGKSDTIMKTHMPISDSEQENLKDVKLKRDDLPALYHTATLESGNAQNSLLRLTKLNLFFLTLGATLSAINISGISDPNYRYLISYGSTAMLIISIIITFAMEQAKYERKWYDGRAIAESIKTLAWRFMMNSEPYKSEAKPNDRFRDDLYAVLKDRKSFAELLGGDTSTHQQLTDTMEKIRKSDLSTRKQVYLVNRIQNQKKWYNQKSKINRNHGATFFWILMGVQVVAILASILLQKTPDFIFNPTGVLTTVAAGLLAWMQLKQYRTLAESYGLTTHELGIIESKVQDIRSNEEFSDFVLEAETAISREHTVWLARRVNV